MCCWLINKLSIDTKEITDQNKILEELGKHFEKMGQRKICDENLSIQNFLNNIDANKLSEIDKLSIELPLQLEEIGKALYQLDNDSSPGLDGISANWYKVFFNKVKFILFDCFNQAINERELATTQKLGVITLIHKGKELKKDIIKNWRAITVTKCDYKIFF